MDQRTLQISGRLVASSHQRPGGLRVEAWDKEGLYPQVIGVATIDDQGAFRIELDESVLHAIFRDRQPGFAFKIFRGETLLNTAPDAVTWFVIHHLIWRLIDQATETPLPGYSVSAFDLDAGREPKDLGKLIVNDKGLFTLNYTMYPDPTTGTVQRDYARRFRLQVLDPQSRQIYQTEIRVRTTQTQVLELRVPSSTQNQPTPAAMADAPRPITPLRNVPQKPSLATSPTPEITLVAKTGAAVPQVPRPISTVADLADTLHLDIPSELRAYIRERGISNLSDILSTGGLAHLPGLPLPPNDPGVQTLEAHARLSILPTDVQTNANLIAAGYTNLYDIASALPSQFTAKIKATIEAPTARAIYTAAQAQVSYLTNEITRLRVEAANGSPVSATSPLAAMIPQTCGCQDCENVTSPLAYLADLLDYTVRHLMVNGALINIDQLSARFCQPLARLPASCEQLDERVRQVRICIEVLRRYLNDTSEHPEYTLAAYESLLRQNGTSYEELRLVRPAQRKALAERLGLDLDPTRPDQLDGLLLSPHPPHTPKDPEQLTEESLENLFGLISTKRDPLASGHTPLLQFRRWQHLTRVWQNEDASPNAPFHLLPVIDPDIIDAADLAYPTPGNRAYGLWLARQTLITQTITQIKLLREDPNIGLAKLLPDGQYGLGSAFGRSDGPTVNDVIQAYQGLQNGADISAMLRQWRLDADAFSHLGAVITLDNDGFAVQESEWHDVYKILTRRLKLRDMFSAWRMEEQQSPAITLIPDWFQLRPMSLADGTDWVPTAWLSDEAVRRQWVKTLQARVEQQQEVVTALQDAVQTTEEATLTGLRGILLINTALPGTLSDAKTHALTRRLQIDCEAGACDMTTRIAQAIATLQGVLFGARNGLLEDPAVTLDAPNFDEEWQWIGSYATWRAAMLVFLYPENALFPNLRHRQSSGFQDLITFCQNVGRLDADYANQAVEQYQSYFADICSLQPKGLRRTAGMLKDASVLHPDLFDFFPFHPDVFAIGQGSASGSFYWSSWHWDTAGQRGGADQTLWNKIKGLNPSNQLVGLLPYHNTEDQVRMGLYFHSRKGGIDAYTFATADGTNPLSTSGIEGIPPFVCTSVYQGTIPASATLKAAGGNGWTMLSSDQLAALDVDGDGRNEVVIIARTLQPDGTQRVGLVREFGGGFVLDWSGSVEGGWRLPDVRNPITYLPAPFSGNASKRWGVFVVNSNGPQARIGTLGWSPTTGLSISSATSIAQTNGPANWQVNLATTINGDSYPTVFIGANLNEGAGLSVLAFEYTDSSNTDTPVKTLVTVLSPGATFALVSSPKQELNTLTPAFVDDQNTDPGTYAIAWKTFCPARTGEILLFGTRQEYTDENIGHLYQHHVPLQGLSVWFGSLLWQNGQFVIGQNSAQGPTITRQLAWTSELNTQAIAPGGGGHPGWTIRENDQLTALAPGYVIAQNNSPTTDFTAPTSLCFGVLRYRADTNAWVCETALRKNETLPAAAAGGPTWTIQPDDRVVTWLPSNNPLAAGFPPLLISADGARVGALTVQNTTPAVMWVLEGQIYPPGDLDGMQWSGGPDTSFLIADIDHDGYVETIARRNVGTDDVRVAILRSVPPPLLAVYGQPPARYGPVAVTLQDIPANLSDTALQARAIQQQAIYAANDNDLARVNDVYLDEAYYFVPMEIGRRLEQSGYYTAALDWFRTAYDYDLPVSLRKIAYKLVVDSQSADSFDRASDWLSDPLNPHAIAETRQNSYTKYTLLEIVRCLLAYADSEFTQANAESVPRARALYMLALDLLIDDVFQPKGATCSTVIGELDIQVGEGYWKLQWSELLTALGSIKDFAILTTTAASVKTAMMSNEPFGTRLAQARAVVNRALASQQKAQALADVVQNNQQVMSTATTAGLIDPVVMAGARSIGFYAAGKALTEQQVIGQNMIDHSAGKAHIPPGHFSRVYVPAPSFAFCIPSNASIETFQQHAELNLNKIRHCQNIAGFPMQLDPYVLPNAQEASLQTFDLSGQLPIFNLPALQPLPYRFATLIERAKQLVQFAQQIEDKMLAAIANQDAQAYDELKARQDLSLAQAGVRLNDLQLVEASDGVTLAQLQQGRAQIQQQHYSDLLNAGVSGNEQASLDFLTIAATLQQGQAATEGTVAAANFYFGNIIGGLQSLGSAMGAQAQMFSTLSQLSSATASYERRAQEWQLQQEFATQDFLIGGQQIQIAQDHVLVAAQNRAIAAMQVDHAEALLNFIATKRFTNGALYEWMSGVLQQVYHFFVQQAIPMAQLAEFQLAFERQQIAPAFIQTDYWQPPAGSAFASPANATTATPADTRGLTGAERLLADITALDQYAFQTDQRKLQLTRTISLAQLDAFAFQQFRQSGVLNFATPMDLFDQDFPGHYLRLIKRVSTSVIALVPPGQGIRATLATTGGSRVVIGGNSFQKVVLQRGPEQVALSSPANATGLFTLDAQAELLVPFEGIGVDTTWELQMPRAANPIDYDTIADVLITIDYTALSSPDYRQQVIRKLDLSRSADRGYSFRYQFADQWYELHYPNQSATPMVVTFTTERNDFPPNFTDVPTIKQVVLYFVPKGDQPFEITSVNLLCDGVNSASADTVDGVISTRRGNAAAWIPLIGKPAQQRWTLDLSASTVTAMPGLTIQDLFAQEKVADILFVLTYEGSLPSWPA